MLPAMRSRRERARTLRRAFVLTVAGLSGCSEGAGPTSDLPASDADAAFDALADGVTIPDAPLDVDTARTPTGTVPFEGETLRRNEGTTGKPCIDDATCDPAHTGENLCSVHGYSALGSLYPSPLCIGRECDPGPLGVRPRACDEDHGVCYGDGALVGTCLPGCTFDATSPARGCPEGTLCTPSWIERDVAGAARGEGWCAPDCKTDGECATGEHCLLDEGLCVVIPITRTLAIGERCDAYANPPEIECNCLHDQATGVGVCTALCDPAATTSTCPAGFLCSTGLPVALFPTAPKGVVAHCLLTCTTDAECSLFAGRCADGPTGKTCVVGPATSS
jgi:hypothetical protein